MITVYTFFYDPKSVKEAGKVRELEHETGRKLLCCGLEELYGIDLLDTDGECADPKYSEERPENPALNVAKKQMNWESPAANSVADSVDRLLEAGENGKPYLRGYPDIHFNISHCSGLVVCVFAEQPVGVDVEEVKPVRDSLIRRVLHEEELRVLSRYGQICTRTTDPQSERNREFLQLFFRYWTLKESYLKQDGSGLTREPREICFFVDPDDWDSSVRTSDPGKVCMQKKIDLSGESGKEYVLAVCVPVAGYHGEKIVLQNIDEGDCRRR